MAGRLNRASRRTSLVLHTRADAIRFRWFRAAGRLDTHSWAGRTCTLLDSIVVSFATEEDPIQQRGQVPTPTSRPTMLRVPGLLTHSLLRPIGLTVRIFVLLDGYCYCGGWFVRNDHYHYYPPSPSHHNRRVFYLRVSSRFASTFHHDKFHSDNGWGQLSVRVDRAPPRTLERVCVHICACVCVCVCIIL